MVGCAHLICREPACDPSAFADRDNRIARLDWSQRGARCPTERGSPPTKPERDYSRPPCHSGTIHRHPRLWTANLAMAMSLACAHIVAPPSLLSSRATRRGRHPSLCALASPASIAPASLARRQSGRQWMAQSQSEKAPRSPKTEEEEPTPSWAKPGTEELPPWARNEAAAPVKASGDLPFPVYLIGSCLVAIAAVGSIFEYFNQNPLFGVVEPDNPLWAPILGVFAITGFPSAGFLFYKAISLANKASQEADRADGYDP